ncbi:cyclin-dependent kinase regulatory subunit [Pisolithus orientalis]|uniref:cyclin-dependent kinase regulatory subunit n=1 Tax=Pisolithus orientalis TaxID=936130 RepID=UPI00222402A3|nr:cyclin-dependent kinase regulatory subunit [Pisolithus orientalis]KAI6028574.1 cyclin-dependent kinase regulatory subunit [Pisolithus orientalis]
MADPQLANKIEEYIEKIHYSDRYTDDHYEYRHVILPKPLLKFIPKEFFDEKEGTLRLLTEAEWRGIGITQSLGWQHYEVHGMYDFFVLTSHVVESSPAPEPHVLLFRRPRNYVPPAQPQQAAKASNSRKK